MNFDTLDQWLSHIEKLHSQTIDLGLERMNEMIKRLGFILTAPSLRWAAQTEKAAPALF